MIVPSDRSRIVVATVPDLPVPSSALFEAAARAPTTRAEHDRLALDLPALNGIEYVAPPPRDLPHGPLQVAAWNAERLKHAAASAALVRAAAADVLLLTEADRGMARSGNRHTVADLAAALGMGYAYGVEFVELGLGDAREREAHRGERNRVGFHGNAIVSRFPIVAPMLIRLDDGAVWWVDASDDQRRLGFRMAIAATIETRAGPIAAVVVHLESHTDAADRARQAQRLLDAIDAHYPGRPIVVGGDMNTKSLPPDPAAWIDAPETFEPLFSAFRGAGFDWREANHADPTMRMLPHGRPQPPFRRLDWLFTRGLSADKPRTIEAVDAAGAAISDHDMVAAELRFR